MVMSLLCNFKRSLDWNLHFEFSFLHCFCCYWKSPIWGCHAGRSSNPGPTLGRAGVLATPHPCFLSALKQKKHGRNKKSLYIILLYVYDGPEHYRPSFNEMWELMKAVVTFLGPDGARPPAGSSGHPDATAEVKIMDGTTICLVFLSWSYFSSEFFLPWALWCTWDNESPCPMPVPLSGVSCRMAFFSRKSWNI